jgi:hypothetical protein
VTTLDVNAGPVSVSTESLTATLTEAWSIVLEGSPVGPDDDFFEIGGHSLLIGRVAQWHRERHGIDIPFRLFFEYPTSRQLADAVVRSATA